MAEPDESPAHPGLEVAEDLERERKEWKAERAAWLLLAALIVAAVLGLFGRGIGGPSVRSSPGGSLTVEYDRYLRRGLQSDVTVEVEAAEGDQIGILVSESYLEDMRVEDVLPQPEETSFQGEEILYRFAVTEPGRPMKVRFSLTPEKPWGRQATVRLAGTDQDVAIEQFIYP